MSNDELLTDDYIAELLSQDASDCSIKYSAMGVDAFLASKDRKPSNMPKPNTRFLRNIIKGTDSHNRALLAKEAAESKARLTKLDRAKEIQRKKSNPTTRDIRSRQMGDIQAILGGTKRRRSGVHGDSGRDDPKDEAMYRNKEQRLYRPARIQAANSQTMTEHFDNSGGEPPLDQGHYEALQRHSCRQNDDKRSHQSIQKSHTSGEDQIRSRSSRRRIRINSPRRRRSGSPVERRDTGRRPHRQRSRQRDNATVAKEPTGDDDGPETSGDDMGPVPAPKVRGRGDTGTTSGIDRRFSASYDPKADKQMEDGSDLDGGSEASYMDNQRIRQMQEARAIAAGVVLPRHIG